VKRDAFPFDQSLGCVQPERTKRNHFIRLRIFLNALAHFANNTAGASRLKPVPTADQHCDDSGAQDANHSPARGVRAQDQSSFAHCDVCFLSALISIENRPLHPPERFENTRLASTSDASSDMISSAVRTRSRSATRRLAWRSRMRSSALRIERALENSGWVLRKPM